MGGWILFGLLVLLALIVVARAKRYARLLGDAHLLAIAQGMPALKRAAFANEVAAGDPPLRDGDARVLRTAEGLAIVYTVSRDGTEVVHHCSLSFPGRVVAQAAAEVLLSLVVRLLGFPPEKTRTRRGNANVHHVQLIVSPAEHAELAALPVPEISASTLPRVRAEAVEMRDQLRAHA